MLYFKKLKRGNTTISYKNRFLFTKRSSKFQFIGLLLHKGNKLVVLKKINEVYLNFLYKYHGLNIKPDFDNYFKDININMEEFINLYNAFLLFKDWSRALIWRTYENVPMIKAISKKIKKKKNNKKKKKKIHRRI